MRVTLPVICFTVFLFCAGSVVAQPRVNLFAGAGGGSLVAPGFLRGVWDVGYSVTGGVGVDVLPFLELTGSATYSRMAHSKSYFEYHRQANTPEGFETIRVPMTGYGLSVRSVAAAIKGEPPLGWRLRPYALAGAGRYWLEVAAIEIGDPEYRDEIGPLPGATYESWGAELGIGAAYPVFRNAQVFLEPRYSHLFRGARHRYLNVRSGISFSFR